MRSVDPPLPELSTTLGGRWQLRALGASVFCDTWEARQGKRKLFLKTTAAAGAAMLRAEADGLRALASSDAVRVPSLAALADRSDGGVLLALEWLDLAQPDADFGWRLGEAVARLHAQPVAPQAGFGWRIDNYIGATPQTNTAQQPPGLPGWVAFFTASRLAAMRDRLPPGASALRAAVDEVIDAFPGLFTDGHEPRPCLIHGDLWQGNWGMLDDGTPVLWDPAVSRSDAEAELAMATLFGSPPHFRAGYERAGGHWPPEPRLRTYQLYHLLHHTVLFGGSYEQQALRVARGVSP